MSTIGQFEEAYNRLNVEQRHAVDAVEGPVMVIAGPGTGKTTILTLRVANILRVTDADPDSILALTFTEAAAHEMRARLVRFIGPVAYRIVISTFHGFCNQQIQDNPEEFPTIIGGRPATDTERITIMEELVRVQVDEILRPVGSPLFHVRAILSAIAELKREGVDPDEFEKRVAQQRVVFEENPDCFHERGAHAGKMKGEYQREERFIQKNEALLLLYRCYQEELLEKRLYDFDDMIVEVIRVLGENEDFKLTLQERYQYLLADEHQDANGAQNLLLELLSDYHDSPNLFIVGDDKQAIFRFQGASLENFLYFKKKYPQAKEIVLRHNYRSTQIILDAASSLIDYGAVAVSSISLEATSTASERPIVVFDCPDEETEMAVVVNEIERHREEGIAYAEIALLVRDNNDVVPIIAALKEADIPFVLESKQDLFSDNEIQKVLVLLRAVHYFGEDEHWVRSALLGFVGIDPLDVRLLNKAARSERISVYQLVRSLRHLAKIDLGDCDAIRRHYKNLAAWAILAQEKPLLELFDRVVEDSGFLSFILSHRDAMTHVARLRALFEELRRLSSSHPRFMLSDFIEYLRILDEHGIVVKKGVGSIKRQGVRILTAHGAKGREFDVVFVMGAVDGHWGNRRRRATFRLPLIGGISSEEENDDERRLLYVGLTRARLWVGITFARSSVDGREHVPSQFLSEILTDFLQEGDISDAEERIQMQRFQEKKREDIIVDRAWVGELFKQQGLSVTALNNFLECPWKYFFMNLIHMPRSPAPHQFFGIAVHSALRFLFDALREDKEIGKEYVLERFRERLRREWMDSETIDVWRERGEKALGGYYDHYNGSWVTTTLNELSVGGVELESGVLLKGKLDKLEFLDGSNDVNVVDYKTGKPKSRNVIEGKTKGSDGAMKRQLVFYRLLLDLDDSRYHFISGEIDFVEPSASGRYKKEQFIIEDAEVEALKATINDVSLTITEVSFWDERCENRSCEYCQMREMMG